MVKDGDNEDGDDDECDPWELRGLELKLSLSAAGLQEVPHFESRAHCNPDECLHYLNKP